MSDDQTPAEGMDPTYFQREFSEMAARLSFLTKIAEGTPEFLAGIEVGWSPAEIRRTLGEPDFRETIEAAKECADGAMERVLYRLGQRGNMTAVQMWLFNRQPGRWKDVKRIEITQNTKVEVSVIAAVKEGALQLLREQGTLAVQQLAIEATASE